MLPDYKSKIMDLKKVLEWRLGCQYQGKHVVFTNGVFDLIHPGHVHYLSDARNLGDALIIGVNSDASVKRLGKGSNRPLNTQIARCEVLAGLQMVDALVVFDDDTPIELIKALHPDVLVKGGDYTKDTIVGASEVEAAGGTVKVIPFLEGYSTTALEQRIREAR